MTFTEARLEVDNKLIRIMDPDATDEEIADGTFYPVYFQPPEDIHMQYPCIVYHRKTIGNVHADNRAYAHNYAFQVTLIDANPVSPYLDRLLELPYCKFDNHFRSEGLNHDVFTIYI